MIDFGNLILKPYAEDHEVLEALNHWCAARQPCQFGKVAAKKNKAMPGDVDDLADVSRLAAGRVEDGVAAYESLLSKLADVPTPAGPTPRQIGAELVQITSVRQVAAPATEDSSAEVYK